MAVTANISLGGSRDEEQPNRHYTHIETYGLVKIECHCHPLGLNKQVSKCFSKAPQSQRK